MQDEEDEEFEDEEDYDDDKGLKESQEIWEDEYEAEIAYKYVSYT